MLRSSVSYRAEAESIGHARRQRFAGHINLRKKAVKLEQFLVKAKVSGYAGGGEERVLADGCKELTFREGKFTYRDRYFGSNPFIGEEVVWEDDRVTWAMNYYGVVLNEVVPANQTYAFLQKAMSQVAEDRPFRGPSSFKEADYEYLDESQGTIERFTGIEKIFYRGREIYRLTYHGGRVKAQ